MIVIAIVVISTTINTKTVGTVSTFYGHHRDQSVIYEIFCKKNVSNDYRETGNDNRSTDHTKWRSFYKVSNYA